MLELNLPKFDVRLEKIDNTIYIWDSLRKKNLVLTPEEWTRQHFVNYLIQYFDYPISKIANEIEIKVHNLKKRCDTIIYNNFLEPVMIVEYKAPNIKITDKVIAQILRYNITLQVEYLVLSNGLYHYCFKLNKEENKFDCLDKIPSYKDL